MISIKILESESAAALLNFPQVVPMKNRIVLASTNAQLIKYIKAKQDLEIPT